MMIASKNETQASRLLALALSALDRGDPRAADELTALAMEFMNRAIPGQPVVRQQQLIQPKKN
jgi:hypothetical protein